MSEVLAYFLTWTTYGTRLHGDPRGTVDRYHNTPGTPVLPSDPKRQAFVTKRMRDAPFLLNNLSRPIADQAIRDHAAIRNWDILALNVRTNHVHVVVNCRGTHSPDEARQQFKTWGTRRLINAGEATSDTRVWTDDGSTRYLDSAHSLMSAINYVLNCQ